MTILAILMVALGFSGIGVLLGMTVNERRAYFVAAPAPNLAIYVAVVPLGLALALIALAATA